MPPSPHSLRSPWAEVPARRCGVKVQRFDRLLLGFRDPSRPLSTKSSVCCKSHRLTTVVCWSVALRPRPGTRNLKAHSGFYRDVRRRNTNEDDVVIMHHASLHHWPRGKCEAVHCFRVRQVHTSFGYLYYSAATTTTTVNQGEAR